jgi:acetyl-CoA acetyltransferase
MADYGLSEEGLATVAVIQREWAALNPRAYVRDPLTIDEVMESRIIAWPIRKLMCCLVTDGGGALILTSADRAADFPQKPVYIMGTGESIESPLTAQIEDLTSGRAFRQAGQLAFAEAGLAPADIDHLMIYDAFAQLPVWGLEDLGFVGKGEAGDFIAERRTAPGGELPMNTNGGGMSYTHTGMYGMFAMLESIRQMRGTAAAQIEGARTSLTHGVGKFFEAGATVIFSNQRP